MSQPEKTEKPKAYSYLRFSTPEQRKGDSERRQTELAKRYAETHGLELDSELTYKDLGLSGFHGANVERGSLAEFLDAVERGIVPKGSFLLVENLDRLSRKTPRKALRILEDIVEAGIVVVTLMDGKQFTQASLDGFDLFHALLTMIRAHEESATKQRRAKESWKASLDKASKGEARGASAGPAWLRPSPDGKRWEAIPERADVIRQIYRLAKGGKGKEAIAKLLNSEGVPTFGNRAKQWHGSYIYRVLNNRAVLGEHTPIERGLDPSTDTKVLIPQKPIKNYYPRIVSQSLWEDVQSIAATNPRRGRHSHAPVSNILGGLARCAHCGDSMVRVNKGEWKALVCRAARGGVKDDHGHPKCKYESVSYSKVETTILDNLERLCAEAPPQGQKTTSLQKQLTGLQQEIEDITDALENLLMAIDRSNAPAPESILAKIRLYETELNVLRGREGSVLEALKNTSQTLVQSRLTSLLAEGKKKNPDRTALNACLRSLLNSVFVSPKRGELAFEWKHSENRSDLLFAFPARS